MASVKNIIGYNNKRTGVNELLAVYGNGVVDVTTGLNPASNTLNISTSDQTFEWTVFMDKVFTARNNTLQNVYDGTEWKPNEMTLTPKAKFIHAWKNRLYLANCIIPNGEDDQVAGGIHFTNLPRSTFAGYLTAAELRKKLLFPSRVFYSDLPQYNSNLTWGLWYGRSVGDGDHAFLDNPISKIIGLPTDTPVDYANVGLKVGDPIFPVNWKQDYKPYSSKYFIKKIEGPQKIYINEDSGIFDGSASAWMGSNWFDTGDDSSDEITGMGSMTDRLLVFKLFSLWYYTGSAIRKVKDTPGTSSNKSIINAGGYTYYFHGSDQDITGIYRYNGVDGTKFSRSIDPYIRGMNTANYDDVVAWREGETLRWYLGDLSNTNYGISMTNAVASYHLPSGAWDVSPIAHVITCATTWRDSGGNALSTYVGTSTGEVLKMNSGNSHNGTPIRMNLETKWYYPLGSETINEFSTVQVIGRQTRGVKVQYRLANDPIGIGEWENLGELSDDKTELAFSRSYNQASGIKYRFFETGSLENDTYIEKISTFYTPQRRRVL